MSAETTTVDGGTGESVAEGDGDELSEADTVGDFDGGMHDISVIEPSAPATLAAARVLSANDDHVAAKLELAVTNEEPPPPPVGLYVLP